MTPSIVKRLRNLAAVFGATSFPKTDGYIEISCREAADTIEELTEQNRRVKLVMGGALTMLAGYDADAANELRGALNEGDASPSLGGALNFDEPDAFERWWHGYKHKNREPANYSIKKCIAFDAFHEAMQQARAALNKGDA